MRVGRNTERTSTTHSQIGLFLLTKVSHCSFSSFLPDLEVSTHSHVMSERERKYRKSSRGQRQGDAIVTETDREL